MDPEFFSSLKSSPALRGALVTWVGSPVFSWGDISGRYPVYSASKTFLSAAALIAADMGFFDLSAPAFGYLSHRQQSLISPEAVGVYRSLPVEKWLTMGISGYPFRPQGQDWESFCLGLPAGCDGTLHYSNVTAYILGLCLENALNTDVFEFMEERLLRPLDIMEPTCARCPSGHFYGATGMELSVKELHRMGELLLAKGCFSKKRIISEKMTVHALSPLIPGEQDSYGCFIWVGENYFYISGKWGQKCLVFPEKELIITYLSHQPQGDTLFEAAKNFGDNHEIFGDNMLKSTN